MDCSKIESWRVGNKIVALNVTSVGVGRRNRLFLFMCSRKCLIIIIIIIIIIITVFAVAVVMFQNHQKMVTFFGCCWYSGGAPQSPNYWVPATCREDRCRGMEGDSGIVIEDVCEDSMQSLARRLVLMLMRGGILIGEVVVVAVGIISFSDVMSVMEVECEVISSTWVGVVVVGR